MERDWCLDFEFFRDEAVRWQPLARVIECIKERASAAPLFGQTYLSRFNDLCLMFEDAFPERIDFRMARYITHYRAFGIPRVELASTSGTILLSNGLDHIKTRGPFSKDVIRTLAWIDRRSLEELGQHNPTILANLVGILQNIVGDPTRAFARLDGTGLEDGVLNAVLLPVQAMRARVNLRGILKNSGGPLNPAIPTASEIVALIDVAYVGLKRHLNWETPERDPFHIDINGNIEFLDNAKPAGCIWHGLDVTSNVLRSVHTLVDLFLEDDIDIAKSNDSDLARCARRILHCAQALWLTARSVRPRMHEENWMRKEASMLASLHLIERANGNNFRAAQYAVCSAVTFAFASKSRPEKDWTNLRVYEAIEFARQLGAEIPFEVNRNWWNSPAQAMMVTRLPPDHSFREVLNRIESAPGPELFLHGFGFKGVEASLYGNSFSPEVKAAAFAYALRRGFLKFASAILFRDQNRSLTPYVSTDLIAYADTIAGASQKLVATLDFGFHNRLKNSVRKLWNQVDRENLTFRQHLFIHHLTIGLTYHALAKHRQKMIALAYAARSPAEDHLIILDKEADQIRFGSTHALCAQDFDEGIVKVSENSAFISLSTFEGHNVSILAIGPDTASFQQVFNSTVYSTKDWPTTLKKFSHQAREDIYACHFQGDSVYIDIPDRLTELVTKLLEAARKVSPNVSRLFLHVAAFWDVLPWQLILNRILGDRQEPVMIVRVPGLKAVSPLIPADPNKGSTPLLSKIAHDESPTCRYVAVNLDEKLVGEKPGGTLSLVSHGTEGSIGARLSSIDEITSRQSIRENYGGFHWVMLHVCHGAAGGQSSFTRDIDSLPHYFQAHGSRVIIAPGLPIHMDLAVRMEKAIFSGTYPPKSAASFFAKYCAAIQTDPELAQYTFFSPDLAPRLELPKRKRLEWRVAQVDASKQIPMSLGR